MSICGIFDARYHVIALLINFQLSAGIAMLTGLKMNLYNKNIYVYMENVFYVKPCFYSL